MSDATVFRRSQRHTHLLISEQPAYLPTGASGTTAWLSGKQPTGLPQKSATHLPCRR
ncbi:hypothetical protein AB0K18_02695 [Nonomuraea sp. NPDC049421]|uniref:hypothetical protein n=1 Tax=Nonomuraea sp. NPDC049421 TaxID=3155275 RepID=UPI003430A6C7